MTYQTKFWLTAALALGSAAILGTVIGTTIPSSGGAENSAVLLPIFFVLLGGVAIANWLWWKRTDDLQQQGQLISWWWGGNFGAVAMLICLVTITGRHSEMSVGAMYLFLAQFVGFALVWLFWKFRGRGLSE